MEIDFYLVTVTALPPTSILYAALQHGFHSTFYSFRASAAHIMSPNYPERLRQIDIHASATFQQRNLPATQESRLAGLPE
jgi:hypothetical protein